MKHKENKIAHELGHAVMIYYYFARPGSSWFEKFQDIYPIADGISLGLAGGHNGGVYCRELEDRMDSIEPVTNDDEACHLEAFAATMLAGQVAERLFCGNAIDGSDSQDIALANRHLGKVAAYRGVQSVDEFIENRKRQLADQVRCVLTQPQYRELMDRLSIRLRSRPHELNFPLDLIPEARNLGIT